MTKIIHFYRVGDEYGEFSNFAPYRIHLDDAYWKTSEHYFQAMKFENPADRDAVRFAHGPMEAANIGRDRKRKLRRDWESAKDDVMRKAVRAKFTQHDELRALLVATDDATLVEHTGNDAYWGDGGDGRGRNRLGQILMEIRTELREAVET